MIPVHVKRVRGWQIWEDTYVFMSPNFTCKPATAWTWDIGSYYWYMYD